MSDFVNISTAGDAFLVHKAADGRSPHTLRNYEQTLNLFIDYTGNVPLNEITPRQVEGFFQHMRERKVDTVCGTTRITPKKLSDKTIKNYWSCLSPFWKWAANEYKIDNPLTLPMPKARTKPVDPVDREDINRIVEAIEHTKIVTLANHTRYKMRRPTAKRDKALILTLVDTGIRVTELCDLKVKDVDLKDGRLVVTGKGNKTRHVYLGKIGLKFLWSYLTERYPNGDWKGNDPVFTDQTNLYPLTRDGVRNLVRRLGNAAGIPDVHPHRFRHTFAIEFLRNGGNIFTLQAILGHTSLDMVKNYLQIVETDLQNAHRSASPVDNWRIR